MKANGLSVKNGKANARHFKLSKNKARRQRKGTKVLDAGILSEAGKILGVKVA